MKEYDESIYAMIADAAYAVIGDEFTPADVKKALLANGFSAEMAEDFTKEFVVVAVSPKVSESDFQAVVFKGSDGDYIVSSRGTASPSDIKEDIARIGLEGVASHQGIELFNWYQRLTAKEGDSIVHLSYELIETTYVLSSAVEVATADGVLVDKNFTSVGHSLGGHLATLLSRFAGGDVDKVYSFNGPGFDIGLGAQKTESFLDLIRAAQIRLTGGASVTDEFDDKIITNIVVSADLIHRVGVLPGSTLVNYDEKNDPVFSHSISYLNDALRVGALLEKIDISIGAQEIYSILSASSARDDNTLETVVGALSDLFVGKTFGLSDSVAVTSSELYIAVQALSESLTPTTKWGALNLKDLSSVSAGELASLIYADVAYRYAAFNGNAFVVTGVLPVYETQEVKQALSLYNKITGEGALTDEWIRLRSEYLSALLLTNEKDLVSVKNLNNHRYQDLGSGSSLAPYVIENEINVVFGSSGSDAIAGKGTQDYLFGGDGEDVLNGNLGADYLEGGAGNDVLNGGGGNDTLVGMTGGDRLTGGAGNDILDGGIGSDVYSFSDGDGFDQIYDLDGSGVIRVNNLTLKGGESQGPETGVWFDAENKIRYVVSGVQGDKKLTIYYGKGDYIVIDHYQDGYFGISLPDYQEDPIEASDDAPEIDGVVIYGDFAPLDQDPGQNGVQEGIDELGNLIIDPGTPEPDRDDFIYDSVGSDSIFGVGGNDSIIGGRGGSDWLDGGDGDDYIQGGDLNDTIFGAAGDDRIIGGKYGTGTLDGGDGNDHIEGGKEGAGTLNGGEGNDYIKGGELNDTIEGGAGSDIVYGGTGEDSLYGDLALTLSDTFLKDNKPAGRGDWIDAGDDNDLLIGGSGADALLGGGGDDTIAGGAGDDAIFADSDRSSASIEWDKTVVRNTNTISISVTGAAYQDALLGGNDLAYGGAGNDWLSGGYGNDTLDGGDDDDIVAGGVGSDILIGGNGDDSVFGDGEQEPNVDEGSDYLDGGEGDDVLVGGGRDDVLFGGSGDDRLYGDKETTLVSNLDGNDYLDGGDGDDFLYGAGKDDTLKGGIGNDTLYGDSEEGFYLGSDYLDGGAGDDLIVAGGGNDTIIGGEGNDLIDGDSSPIDASLAGDDYIDAGGGDDYIIGGSGSDIIYGGQGNDTIGGDDPFESALHGNDYIDGGDGDDVIDALGGNDTVFGGTGKDIIQAGEGDNYIVGGSGNDVLRAGSGADVYQFSRGDGSDTIYDDGGANQFLFAESYSPSNIKVQLLNGQYLSVGVGGDVVVLANYQKLNNSSFQFADGTQWSFVQLMALLKEPLVLGVGDSSGNAVGGAGSDTITVGSEGALLRGQGGDDVLTGGLGDDVFYFDKGDGNDVVVDTNKNDADIVQFGAGIERSAVVFSTLTGADGNLALKASYLGGSVTINEGAYGAVTAFQFADGSQLSLKSVMATLPGVELIQSDTFGGVLYGSNGEDTIYGGSGQDALVGQDGNDQIDGGAGADAVYGDAGNDTLVGAMGNDTLVGGAGNDVLFGGSGDDVIDGGDGNDYISGGAGADLLNGGEGTDTYVLQTGMQHDVILDSGTDIDLLTIDASVNTNDLVAKRSGDDLIIQNRYYDDSVTVNNYYQNPEKWKVSDSVGQITSMSEFVTALEGLPSSGLDFYSRKFQAEIQASFAQRMSGYSLTSDGKYTNTQVSDYQYSFNSSTFVASSIFVVGEVSAKPTEVQDSSVDGVVLGELSQTQSSITEVRGVAPSHLAGGQGSYTPKYYPAYGGTGFAFNWGDTIVQKLDSSGELLGFYVYPGQVQNVQNKTFTWTTTVTVEKHVVASGGDGGENIHVGLGNIFYGGAGDDSLTGIENSNGGWGVLLDGGEGNDTLRGSAHDDVLAGGEGNNIISGSDGSDTYVISSTSGKDIVSDYAIPRYFQNEVTGRMEWHFNDPMGSAIDVIALPDGITLENVLASWGSTFAEGLNYNYINLMGPVEPEDMVKWKTGAGTTALMQYTTLDLDFGNGKAVQIVMPGPGQFKSDGIEIVRFSDGTEMSVAALAAHFGLGIMPDTSSTGVLFDGTLFPSVGIPIAGGAGDDTITGSGLVQGWQGADRLTGTTGDDTLSGGTGQDTLDGGAGNDTLRGDAGDDLLNGGAGDDVYVYRGYADKDVINSEGGGFDGISFEYINSGQLSFFRQDGDLVIVVDGNFDQQVRVVGQFSNDTPAIGYVVASGTTLTSDDILPLLIPYPTGNQDNLIPDQIQAVGNNSFVYGGGGNDILMTEAGTSLMDGGTGNDLFWYTGGNATIVDEQGTDAVLVDNGVSMDDVKSRLTISGDDLVIDFGFGEGKLTIKDYFAGASHRIEEIANFAGESLYVADVYSALGLSLESISVEQFDSVIKDVASQDSTLVGSDFKDFLQGFNGDDLLSGYAGNDNLDGGNGNDLLVGGAGDDYLIGGRGNDTYYFAAGDGSDIISNSGGGDDNVVLQGMDVERFMNSFSRNGDALIINNQHASDTITITDWFSGGDKMVGRFVLDDGVVTAGQISQKLGLSTPEGYISPIYTDLPEAQDFFVVSDLAVESSTLIGSSSNDLLIGGRGNDTLIGGAGNDYLVGGDGDDVYMFNAYSNKDIIDNHSNSISSDRLVIEAYDPSTVWFSKSDEDLVVTILDTKSELTIRNWYSDESSKLSGISAGGIALYANQVDSMVEAMATFGSPNGGEINLTPDQTTLIDQMWGVHVVSGGGAPAVN